MKYIDGPVPVLEMTRRNLEVLLAKLDDPHSHKMIGVGTGEIWVKAVENDEHYANEGRPPGLMLVDGEFL